MHVLGVHAVCGRLTRGDCSWRVLQWRNDGRSTDTRVGFTKRTAFHDTGCGQSARTEGRQEAGQRSWREEAKDQEEASQFDEFLRWQVAACRNTNNKHECSPKCTWHQLSHVAAHDHDHDHVHRGRGRGRDRGREHGCAHGRDHPLPRHQSPPQPRQTLRLSQARRTPCFHQSRCWWRQPWPLLALPSVASIAACTRRPGAR